MQQTFYFFPKPMVNTITVFSPIIFFRLWLNHIDISDLVAQMEKSFTLWVISPFPVLQLLLWFLVIWFCCIFIEKMINYRNSYIMHFDPAVFVST